MINEILKCVAGGILLLMAWAWIYMVGALIDQNQGVYKMHEAEEVSNGKRD